MNRVRQKEPAIGTHIVLAGFGTSSGAKNVYQHLKERFEERLRQEIPIGYTSRVGSPKLLSVVKQAARKGVRHLVIAPLFMLPGEVVYRDIVALAETHSSSFKSLSVAEPLLPDRRVFAVMAREITRIVADNALTSWGVLLVGHGTREEGACRIYEASLRQAREVFPPAVPVELGHMEFSPPFAKDCLATLLLSRVKHVIIQPFMIVDGIHIDEVRQGLDVHTEPHSWHRELSEAHGEIVRSRLLDFEFTFMPPLGRYGGVFDIFFDHALRAQSPMV